MCDSARLLIKNARLLLALFQVCALQMAIMATFAASLDCESIREQTKITHIKSLAHPHYFSCQIPEDPLISLTRLVIPPLRVKRIKFGNLYVRVRNGRKEFIRQKSHRPCRLADDMVPSSEELEIYKAVVNHDKTRLLEERRRLDRLEQQQEAGRCSPRAYYQTSVRQTKPISPRIINRHPDEYPPRHHLHLSNENITVQASGAAAQGETTDHTPLQQQHEQRTESQESRSPSNPRRDARRVRFDLGPSITREPELSATELRCHREVCCEIEERSMIRCICGTWVIVCQDCFDSHHRHCNERELLGMAHFRRSRQSSTRRDPSSYQRVHIETRAPAE